LCLGIEVNGSEYAYGGNALIECTGVYEMTPKQHDIFIFKQSIEVGEVANEQVVWNALNKMMKKFKANQYDMLKQNCNHFSNEFLVLLIGRGLPRHCNRIAYIGSYLHCLVPRRYLIVTPPDEVDIGIESKQNWDVVKKGMDSKSTRYDSRE
jgi:hypothetical protein